MSPAKMQTFVETADRKVMELCEPDKMSPAEAIEFLEMLIGNLEGAIEALKEENDL